MEHLGRSGSLHAFRATCFAHLGDDTSHHIIGVGNIKLTMYDGHRCYLRVYDMWKFILLGILYGEGCIRRCQIR
jgi:hypothetical protein